MVVSSAQVSIIGAGISGLTCAKLLSLAGIHCQIFEASDDIGGRVRTDQHEGFLLDRGFQVFLTSYPEAQKLLDYSELELGCFSSGAIIWTGKTLDKLVDPWRHPSGLIASVFSDTGTLTDKFKIGMFRSAVCQGDLNQLMTRPQTTAFQRLAEQKFSPAVMQRFLRPFLGGIFLEHELQTSSRMLEFVWRMFSVGLAALPARGMQQIPRQLATGLPENTIHLHSPVSQIETNRITLNSGDKILSDWIVLATEETALTKLLPELTETAVDYRGVYNLYFSAPRSPINEPFLVLNGSGGGIVNNLAVPSLICPAYAPAGQTLISITVLEAAARQEHNLADAVQSECRVWFGDQVADWRHLQTYHIPYALPDQTQIPRQNHWPDLLEKQILICGDHTLHGSLQGAMQSGRSAAETILSKLALPATE